MSSIPEWSKFTLKISINKPLHEVYDAWTKPNKLVVWFLEKAEYKTSEGTERKSNENIKTGDLYQWKWNNWDVIEKGTVLAANGKDNLSFSFGKAGNVNIHLKEKDKKTEVTLIQDEIPSDDESKMKFHEGCSRGWAFWLVNLKAWLEYGILLNAKGLKQDEVQDLVNS